MTIECVQREALSLDCETLMIGVFQIAEKFNGIAGTIDRALGGCVKDMAAQQEFTAKIGQSLWIPTFGKMNARNVVFVGLGEKKMCEADLVRKTGGQIVKLAEKMGVKDVVVTLPATRMDSQTVGQVFAEGLVLSAYRFHAHYGRLRQEEITKKRVERVRLCEPDVRILKAVQEGVVRGMHLAEATCYARDLVNAPSSHMTPGDLANEAQKLIGKGINVKIMNQAEMEKRGMGAALAVARGSEHAPFGVHLTYRPTRAKKRVAIIGKAVTFDSGGLSIKPADAMMTMKIDMAGAATVLGLFKALAVLRPPIEVHGIFLAVENMPGGDAYRPGDVVTAMDGTTIEVLNTDAEGRVTLADALSYAHEVKPDMMIDLATLTGACVVALGEDVAGVLSTSSSLTRRLLDASRSAGEPLWELPLFEPYQELIKSKIADLKNIGGRPAGTITAALFLKPFTRNVPWAHLDIAGPSYVERETRPDQPYGGSGYGVRLLAEFLERL